MGGGGLGKLRLSFWPGASCLHLLWLWFLFVSPKHTRQAFCKGLSSLSPLYSRSALRNVSCPQGVLRRVQLVGAVSRLKLMYPRREPAQELLRLETPLSTSTGICDIAPSASSRLRPLRAMLSFWKSGSGLCIETAERAEPRAIRDLRSCYLQMA